MPSENSGCCTKIVHKSPVLPLIDAHCTKSDHELNRVIDSNNLIVIADSFKKVSFPYNLSPGFPIFSTPHPVSDSFTRGSISMPCASPKNVKKRRKHVTFGLVDLYHFDRLQGFTCVPSQGGSTLGMANEHWTKERISVIEHQHRRKYQRHSALLRFCLEGKLLLSFQQFRILESRVMYQRQLLAQCNESDQCSTNSVESTGRHLKRSVVSDQNPTNDDLSFLDSLEEYYFLQPLSVRRRRIMLRNAGLQKIDLGEKYECEVIRKSRLSCGCTCPTGMCDPRTCECALNGIPCQVDRTSFPCVCLSRSHCSNPEGRIEFNLMRVRTHYLHTRMRLESQDAKNALDIHAIVPAKRPCFIEVPIALSPKNDCHARFFEDRTSPLSSNALESNTSKSVEEALNATTSNGGCRDCQDDRYVHLLMHELEGQRELQNYFKTDEEEEENETVDSGLNNFAIDSTFFLNDPSNTKTDSVKVGSSSQGQQISEVTDPVLLNSTPRDEDGEDDEDDYDDEDDCDNEDYDDDVLTNECIPRELGLVSHHSLVAKAPKTEESLPTFCRLEPISSLFHPHEVSSSSLEVEEETKPNISVSSRRPPSACEVIIA